MKDIVIYPIALYIIIHRHTEKIFIKRLAPVTFRIIALQLSFIYKSQTNFRHGNYSFQREALIARTFGRRSKRKSPQVAITPTDVPLHHLSIVSLDCVSCTNLEHRW